MCRLSAYVRERSGTAYNACARGEHDNGHTRGRTGLHTAKPHRIVVCTYLNPLLRQTHTVSLVSTTICDRHPLLHDSIMTYCHASIEQAAHTPCRIASSSQKGSFRTRSAATRRLTGYVTREPATTRRPVIASSACMEGTWLNAMDRCSSVRHMDMWDSACSQRPNTTAVHSKAQQQLQRRGTCEVGINGHPNSYPTPHASIQRTDEQRVHGRSIVGHVDRGVYMHEQRSVRAVRSCQPMRGWATCLTSHNR